MKILDGAKAALYGIFLNYYCYYVINGAFIPRGTVLFFAAACLCVGLDMLQQRYIYVGKEIKCWVLYAVLAFVSTAVLMSDGGDMSYVEDIIKYVQRLMIIMMVAYICERENSIRFGLQLMAVTAVALAISILLVTDDIQLKLDISSGANLSANDAGAIAATGCFAVLFGWGKKGRSSLMLSALKIAAVICCIVIIFLTGSRKSIYTVVIMVAMMLILCLPDYGKIFSFRQVITLVLIGTAAYVFVTENLLPYAEQTNLYTRLFGRGVESAAESDDGRMKLIWYAVEDFQKNPFCGVGFNQFRKLHGNYSHSTYFEPLACSGLIGLLYLYPYYLIVKKQIYLLHRSPKSSYARLKQKELFVYLCMNLFIGIGIPYMYKDAPCIFLGTFIASQTISFEELRRKGALSADY